MNRGALYQIYIEKQKKNISIAMNLGTTYNLKGILRDAATRMEDIFFFKKSQTVILFEFRNSLIDVYCLFRSRKFRVKKEEQIYHSSLY